MRALVILVCILLLGTAGGVAALTAVPATAGIVAGQALGPIRIGAQINDVIKEIGDLYDKTERGGFVVYDWVLTPLLAVTKDGKVLLALMQLSRQYATDGGLSGGSTREAAELAYGKGYTEKGTEKTITLVYDKLGIAFDLGREGVLAGRVTSIFVFMPGQWAAITDAL